MNGNYRYKPEDYSGLLNLPGELRDLYELIEDYKEDSSEENWFFLRKHWEDVFFTIKHREVEGFLNHSAASNLRNYIEELVNG